MSGILSTNRLSLCPTCNGKISVAARSCPHCGHPFYDDEPAPPAKPRPACGSPRDVATATGFVPGLIPDGVTLTEEGLEAIIGEGRTTIVNRVIFGQLDQSTTVPGVRCVSIGNHYLVRKHALDEWIAEHETVQQRSRRGGRRNRRGK